MKPERRPGVHSMRPELLSPAGSWECLEAAVANGADAVYLGTKDFNARVGARNFSLEELKRAVRLCHREGVKVYLAANTLVKNTELQRFFHIISMAYTFGIDGIILQHLSFVEIVKRNFPDLSVFVSTQGAIGNAASASLVKQADRIILPRELTLAEIKRIIASGTRAEIFVHGALCFSYSGLCLFSSFVSNRSGNRGRCAQLCRQKYNNCYPLSTRELCLVRRIPELIRAGICAFKIEGRMRSALYVAVSTRLYRKAIDSYLAGEFYLPKKELAEIEIVFNREFTEGFIYGDEGLVSSEKPMNRGALLGRIEEGEILLERTVEVGDGVGIWDGDKVTGAIISEISSGGRKVESAESGKKVNLHIGGRNGSKIYLTSSPRVRIEPDFQTKKIPLKTPLREPASVFLPRVTKLKAPLLQRFLARAYSMAEAKEIAGSGADIVFYDIFAADFPEPGEWQERTVLGAYLPRIMNDMELSRAFTILRKRAPRAILTGNLGFLAKRSSFDLPVYLDHTVNVFNDIDILFFRRYNVVPILSPELSLVELAGIKDREVAVFCHGDISLVNTKIEIDAEELVDEKGYRFPVRKEDGYWQILNSRPFGMFNDIRKLRTIGLNQFYIDQKGKSAHFVLLYRNILKGEVPDRNLRRGYTAGHLYRSLE